MDRTIGRRVQHLRDARKLKQSELSEHLERAGVDWSQATMSKVERGERPIRLSEAPAVASVLGVSIQDLFTGSKSLESLATLAARRLSEALREQEQATGLVRYAGKMVQVSKVMIEIVSASGADEVSVEMTRTNFLSESLDLPGWVEAPYTETGIERSISETMALLGATKSDIREVQLNIDADIEVWELSGDLPSWWPKYQDPNIDAGEHALHFLVPIEHFGSWFDVKFPYVSFLNESVENNFESGGNLP